MALLPKSFVPSQVKEQNLITPGWYRCIIAKSAVKATSKKTGKYVELKFVVDDEDSPENKRSVFGLFNIVNPNPTAVEIGERQLKQICDACEIPEDEELQDTEELHNIPLWVKIVIEESTSDYPDKNKVTNFKHISWEPPAGE